MRTEEEINKHIKYLSRSYNHNDINQTLEFKIKLSELVWVLDKSKEESFKD